MAGAGIVITSKIENVSANVYCSSEGKLSNIQSIQSHRSYCIRSGAPTTSYLPGMPSRFTYSVVDDEGNTLKDFDTVHEKIMHFIVVRKDLTNFQHLHPDFNKVTGEFTLSNLTFPSDGEYRLFADFTPTSSQMGSGSTKLPVTISQDI